MYAANLCPLILQLISCFNAVLPSKINTNSIFPRNLINLLESTLAGCTNRILFDNSSTELEKEFRKLVKVQSNSPFELPTYLTDYLSDKIDRQLRKLKPFYYWESYDYTRPIYFPNRFINCLTHIYFVATPAHKLHTMSFHFTDYHLRKEKPKFILFWDISNSTFNWKAFREEKFQGLFTDYRL